MKRTDGRMTRFRRADVDTFKQYSDNRWGLAYIHRHVINRKGYRCSPRHATHLNPRCLRQMASYPMAWHPMAWRATSAGPKVSVVRPGHGAGAGAAAAAARDAAHQDHRKRVTRQPPLLPPRPHGRSRESHRRGVALQLPAAAAGKPGVLPGVGPHGGGCARAHDRLGSAAVVPREPDCLLRFVPHRAHGVAGGLSRTSTPPTLNLLLLLRASA